LAREDEPAIWPKFLVRTTNPTAYWIGIRAPIDGPREHRPSTILVRCESLAQGGLLLEMRPLILAAAAAGVASILIWLPFVHGLTRHLKRVTAATAEVARGNFAVHVPQNRRDELGELAGSVNAMAGQLDALVTGQRRFLGDIAHELCSPIARMQAALAILEQRVADAKNAGYVASAQEELDDMSRLVSELLEFSKASVQRDIALRPVPLAPLVAETVAREAGSAEVTCDVPGNLVAQAEPKLLARALGNVLRNAVRYAGGAGPIIISAAPYGGKVALVVADSGPGVPADSLPRLFDAFYRPDSARTRETGGTGLGLAIVKTCIEACGGMVAARNGTERGLEVLFSLPAAAGTATA
jgi:two-component system sensor histidine kinase CpxA